MRRTTTEPLVLRSQCAFSKWYRREENKRPLNSKQVSPIELFSGSTVQPQLKHFHHFGCPVYVLDSALQAGKKIRKWSERARIGINLGSSPQHAKSVALVLSLSSGNVSPQFHCAFDDMFETTTGNQAKLIPKSRWQEKAHLRKTRELSTTQEDEGTSTLPPEAMAREVVQQPTQEAENPPNVEADGQDQVDLSQQQTEQGSEQQVDQNVRRSTRERRPPARMADYIPIDQVAFEAIAELSEPETEWEQANPLLAYKATSDPDTMYLWQAMKEPDANKFREAMQVEIDDHMKGGHWQVVLRSSVPKGSAILPAVWQMKRKRRISTREVYKWKARINIDGSKQIYGVHYDETYAPVVTWATVRYFLIQALIKGWYTKQLVQLIKNLYGQKQAGRVWNQHLVRNLTKLGFTQSSVDECVFYFKKSIFLVYTDDTILLGPDQKELDQIYKMLQMAFNIQDEGNLCDYLGIHITRCEDGTMQLTQPHLIDSILADLGLDKQGATGRVTPALTSRILHHDIDGEPFDERFHYRSIIGKLNFLEKSTRPEIAYAVHQCARFCSNPKQSHAEAVKRIGRYLLETRDKGLILHPNETTFECWVDASHAGEWNRENAIDDPSTAKSRMGFVLMFAGCPLIWSSKLQTEIALSSTEAEYISLSAAMREVLPLLSLMKEARNYGVPVEIGKVDIHCKIFEDNSGALELAKVPKMRPRTKHLNIKYHHFRQHVQSGLLSLHAVTTEQQIADIFTKPLSDLLFQRHRRAICGW
mmetsp:Transcript_28700/g.41073  ORF Transcript_28700/g.41073 Transcript_28700/m.41073 type:complete len:760 (+) Transcript_28700:1583-3862(+)